MEKSRNILFIGHAHPEDNQFALWLASRLKLIGYETWLDREDLLGGEKFWEDVDNVIRNHAAKYLLVYSKNICKSGEFGKLKNGVSKEIRLAEQVAKRENLSDFIIPLNIDGSSNDLYIGANELNPVPFKDGWAEGLYILVEKLLKDGVPKPNTTIPNNFKEGIENKFTFSDGIIDREEFYYANWLKINQLTGYFYVHRFKDERDAKSILYEAKKEGFLFPVRRLTSQVVSYNGDYIQEIISKLKLESKIIGKHRIAIQDVLNETYESEKFPNNRDAYIYLAALVSQTIHLYFAKIGLIHYQMANKSFAYFRPSQEAIKEKIYNISKNNYTTKSLSGKYLDLGRWHYAVSPKLILKPYPAIILKSHIVFTTNGSKLWENKDKIHSERRKKGRRFFNDEWRDLMLAFVQNIGDDEQKLLIPIDDSRVLSINAELESYKVNFDYIEPNEDRNEVLSCNDENFFENEQ